MYQKMLPEMPLEYERWGDPANIPQQMADFSSNQNVFQSQLLLRNAAVRNHIENRFGLLDQVNVTLNALPANGGKVKISTVVPDSMPWSGIYFHGNPVRITAIPAPGYRFSHWHQDSAIIVPSYNPDFEIDISGDTLFTAVFIPDSTSARIVLSEICYHAEPTRNAGDWIEIFNAGQEALSLNGWSVGDDVPWHRFRFSNGTMINPGERLVIASDTALFRNQHPAIQCLGPMGFGLGNSGECITLYDSVGAFPQIVCYADSFPWPETADGLGRTLELRSDTCLPNLPSSWFAGCIGGSPGLPWSPCSEIIFSEINYHSVDTSNAGDWVELYNNTASAKNIGGWFFSDDDSTHLFEIPAGVVLLPEQRYVLYSDASLFTSIFSQINPSDGPFSFGLSASGEAIRLFDQFGIIQQSMVYSDSLPWPMLADGFGYTMELIDPNQPVCEASNWTSGCPGGSPAEALTWPCFPGMVTDNDHPDMPLCYPNPAATSFSIFLPVSWQSSHVVVRISSFNGETENVFVISPNTSRFEVNTTALTPGAYLIEMLNDNLQYKQMLLIAESY